MLQAKPISRFLISFGVVILLLIAPWPKLEETYGKVLRAAGELVFGNFGPKGIVRFRANEETGDSLHDSKIFMGNRDIVKPNGMRPMKAEKISTRYIGYMPTALVAALVLATPIPWRRRLWSLAWGLLWVNCFVAFVLLIIILQKYTESESMGLFQWGGFAKGIVNAMHEVFVVYIGPLFLVPVIIWVAVTFRKGDWAEIMGQQKKATELAGIQIASVEPPNRS